MAPSEVLALDPVVTRADIPALCAGLAGRLRGRPAGVVVCDVAGVARPDVATVEALARLRLTARRHGWRLVVGGAGPDLLALVALLGLTAALPGEPAAAPGEEPAAALPQPGGQAEEREQPGGVEEVVERGDPPA
jgi:ABC-type transporter Mla MlaB component